MPNIFIGGSVLILCNERLYLPEDGISGQSNFVIGWMLVAVLALAVIVARTRIKILPTALFALISVWILAQFVVFDGDWTETNRLWSDFLMIFLASALVCSQRQPLATGSGSFPQWLGAALIVNALAYLPTFSSERFTGFLLTSPTNFSLIMALAASLLALYGTRRWLDVPLIVAAGAMIYLSETRSVLLVYLALLAYAVFRAWGVTWRRVDAKLLIALGLVGMAGIGASLIGGMRDNGADSDATRSALYQALWDSSTQSPLTFLFGQGAGSANARVIDLTGVAMPAHMDILAIIHDLGAIFLIVLIGAIVVAFRRIPLAALIVLSVAVFHNLLFCPQLLVLIFCYLFGPLEKVRQTFSSKATVSQPTLIVREE